MPFDLSDNVDNKLLVLLLPPLLRMLPVRMDNRLDVPDYVLLLPDLVMNKILSVVSSRTDLISISGLWLATA